MESTLLDGNDQPLPGLGAALGVRFRMKPLDGHAFQVDAAAEVADAAAGKVRYQWAAGDTDEPGTFLAEWVVTFADGQPLTVPSADPIVVTTTAPLTDLPPITREDLALIRSHVGYDEPPTDQDLATLLATEGTVGKVVEAVLHGRFLELISGPAKWGLDGDMDVDNSKNIDKLEAELATLRADNAGSMETGRMYRPDVDR
jgi:hypothetical protein